ncbi:MAG: HAMP domain-containing histidine kinase [Clostridium sp.]|nr:HAMP domain-containing histidine kinase [Clostridium sp.]
MRNKKSEKLLVSLFKNYITFVFILLAIFVISYFVLGVSISKRLETSKDIPIIKLLNNDYKDYKEVDESHLRTIGAYMEVLDNNKKVIYRCGALPNELKDSYTEKEFEDIVGNNYSKETIFNTICKIIDKGDSERYIMLIRVPKDKINYSLNLVGIPYKVGKPLYTIYIKTISIAAIFLIISIIIYTIWTTKKIRMPLEEIDGALFRIIEGDYEEKFEMKGQKEFVVISDTINYLIDKLKRSKEENARLQQSKTRMLMDLSHDIKTPMTTIRGFSAALYQGLVDDEDKKERYYKAIYNKSEHVGELVDDLFELVRMEDTQYKLKLESVDICEFIRQIVVDYVDELEEKEFELVVNIPEEIINLNIDVRLFKRVICNLIQNAIKYNPKGTCIRIEVRELKRYVIIEVADNGIGIPEQIRDTIFDAFVRGDRSRSSDGGSGLGLAIASKIVKNHGGDIELYTGSEKDKTIFYIRMYKDFSIE